jgi:hypothetical protein
MSWYIVESAAALALFDVLLPAVGEPLAPDPQVGADCAHRDCAAPSPRTMIPIDKND